MSCKDNYESGMEEISLLESKEKQFGKRFYGIHIRDGTKEAILMSVNKTRADAERGRHWFLKTSGNKKTKYLVRTLPGLKKLVEQGYWLYESE